MIIERRILMKKLVVFFTVITILAGMGGPVLPDIC